MKWFRRRRGEAPSTQRYSPRCAACGYDTDVFMQPFHRKYSKHDACLVVTCPWCGFVWKRECADEVALTTRLNDIEGKDYGDDPAV